MAGGVGVLELAILAAVVLLVAVAASSAVAARARGEVARRERPGPLRRWFVAGLGVGALAGLAYAVWQLLADDRPTVEPFFYPIAGAPR